MHKVTDKSLGQINKLCNIQESQMILMCEKFYFHKICFTKYILQNSQINSAILGQD